MGGGGGARRARWKSWMMQYLLTGFSGPNFKPLERTDISASESGRSGGLLLGRTMRMFVSGTGKFPLHRRSPFAVQRGFQAIARTPKSTKRLRKGSFLLESNRKTQVQNRIR